MYRYILSPGGLCNTESCSCSEVANIVRVSSRNEVYSIVEGQYMYKQPEDVRFLNSIDHVDRTDKAINFVVRFNTMTFELTRIAWKVIGQN